MHPQELSRKIQEKENNEQRRRLEAQKKTMTGN